MPIHRIRKGLDLPISGAPRQETAGTVHVRTVALVADDFPGMKPRMIVKEGDVVKRGQALFEDRKTPGVFFTAPAAGTVEAINRGARRVLQSVIIKLNDQELSGDPDAGNFEAFPSFTGWPVSELSRAQVVALLTESGLWTALRARPFSRIPSPTTTPHAIFVNGMDTNPLAAQPEVVVRGREDDFAVGLAAIAKLSDGKTHLCVAPNSPLKAAARAAIETHEFEGPHPAGTSGVHIHTIAPVGRNRTAWWLGYQDVLAIGHLVKTGRLDGHVVVSVAGPPVQNPRLVRTRAGANLADLIDATKVLAGGLRAISGDAPDVRVISGSVLSGKRAQGAVFGYLGRYHMQVSLLTEGRERKFLGWMTPGGRRFSIFPVFVSRLFGGRKFDLDTDTNGSPRAMVPIGMYEEVMPMDILPTFLLRSLMVGDIEQAEKLGVLELDEEDLALCTFVCPGKVDYGPVLRANLEKIYAEG